MSPETVAYLSRPAPGGCCSRHESGSSATAGYSAGSYSTRSRPRRRTRSRACSLRSSPTCIERRLRESRPCPCPGSQARIKLARFDACLREAAFRSLARAGAGGRRRAARQPPSRARGGCRGPTGSLGRRARTPAGTRGPARGSSKPASDSAPLAPSALCSCCTRSTC